MQDKLNIAVFVDYDNIEIGVKSTLRRDFDVSLTIDALKERGDIVAKFAYANWARQEGATRQMAENAVQMVQRIPSPRGDKNGADINLALDALEMAFTHSHVNAFAIVSGDSDFIPLVNKLKEFGKRIFVVGGKAFTSTILQQNCHEFISYESLLGVNVPVQPPQQQSQPQPQTQQQPQQPRDDRDRRGDRQGDRPKDMLPGEQRRGRPAPLELAQAMPLVERALQVLERREVKPQLGLLKSTMLQLDPTFSERAYGANSFSDFIDRLKKGGFVEAKGSGGHYTIERKGTGQAAVAPKPEESLPILRDVLEMHRLEMEDGVPAEDLAAWVPQHYPNFEIKGYGFQEFGELLNYAQDKTVVRVEPDAERGLMVYMGAEFYPPALPPEPEPAPPEEEEEEPQPIVAGQPSMLEPNPPPVPPPPVAKPRRAPRRKAAGSGGSSDRPTTKRPRRKKPDA
jgi:uncharacterized protein (TIGR00288 family)